MPNGKKKRRQEGPRGRAPSLYRRRQHSYQTGMPSQTQLSDWQCLARHSYQTGMPSQTQTGMPSQRQLLDWQTSQAELRTIAVQTSTAQLLDWHA